ncbi:cysteinyl-tRNA synthetase [Jatrophihabitans sp. GAS493]|uniref:cysteine--tRNA ligase n=1 Tax=Jatrophihabitans sp. GAS493 TaxID=1907575 RepID=UPI000BB7CC3F|nr:cysteine--tRNA ligase [Jatrophihabitans sp. GAS493]SOD70511.1 cysteinyl-tRNA synthetase [Jatrophihabitans sp. GAS493]
MTLHIYDSATRSLRRFEPIEPGKASIYLCGLTVQAPPHIGHMRSSVNFDILRRWLMHTGHEVTFIRNVTDIDDKILAKSADAGVDWWAWAYVNERAVIDAYAALGCLPASYEPRATGHISEMIELIQRLIERGHAYAVGGDVYFDVRSFADYGALSGQRIDEMLPAADSAETSKRDPRDFALWKAAKADEPATASWPTPWGRGRPGWHLECSAMAGRYLGPAFDIHGGGLDLIFPHHENEIAQSVAAGDAFASYWMHNAWVTMSGEKMSKSLGNSLLVTEVVKEWRPVEVRYYLGAAHYRSNVEYSADSLAEAAAAYRRIEGFIQRAVERLEKLRVSDPTVGTLVATEPLPAFVAAMDDDLGVPQALAAIHNAIRDANPKLGDADSESAVIDLAGPVLCMLEVLGLSPFAFQAESADDLTKTVDGLAQILLKQRAEARRNKDFATSDAIRDAFAAAGLLIEDTPTGARWLPKEQ